MSSSIDPIIKDKKEENKGNMKTDLGSAAKYKEICIEDKTMEVINRRKKKEVV